MTELPLTPPACLPGRSRPRGSARCPVPPLASATPLQFQELLLPEGVGPASRILFYFIFILSCFLLSHHLLTSRLPSLS